MEHSAQVGRWSIRFDPDLTANLYLQTAPFESDCTDCANFRAAKNQAFSPPFLPLLRRLGIDPSKPAELSHVGHTGQPMLTQGWLHFVGHLDAGADAWRPAGADTLHFEPEAFPGIKSIGFTSRIAQASEQFRAHRLVQAEFETTVPWVIPVPFG